MNKIKSVAPIFLSTLCFSITPILHAQERIIEEIIVTSTKKEQTLQEIPIAVSVTSADTIQKAGILDLKDLQSVVPSLRINTLQNSTNTNFTIRGFGNGANNPGIEPSVGVFIDGVYRSRSAAQIGDLPNLERVEVLRGPQSTLFGKNASAGVISVVTRAPDGESRGNISATIGNFEQRILKAQVEGALTDNIAFDLSGSLNRRDGYNENEITGTLLNDRDRESLRGQLVFTPNDTTNVRVIADYDSIDEVCCGVNNIVQSPLEAFINSQTGAEVNANQPLALSVKHNNDSANEITNKGLSIQIDQDYDGMALTSITSYRSADSFYAIDADFSTGDYLVNSVDTQIDTFTQEFRLTSTGDNTIDWMVGGFYFDEQIDFNNDLDYGDEFRSFINALTIAEAVALDPTILAGPIVYPLDQLEGFLTVNPGTYFSGNDGINEVASLDNQAFSLFSQADWHISDRLTATLGFNYTVDEKVAVLEQPNVDAFSSLDLETIAGGAFIALQDAQFLPPLQGYPNAVEDGKSADDKLTYAFRLAADVNDDVSVYASVSTGFKATSWNLSRDSRPTADNIAGLGANTENNLTSGTRFAGPEDATAIEIGLKASFERGSLNVAIFDQSIKGFQSNVFLGTGFNLVNAGEQSTQGIEFDLAYYPIDALRLTLAGTFLDPKFDSFENAAVPEGSAFDAIVTSESSAADDGIGSLTGQTPAGIHEVSLSASATYSFVLSNGMDGFVRGDYQYDDAVATNDNVPAELSIEEVKNLNISTGLSMDDGWSVSIWGRNLTDHATTTTAFPTVAGTQGYFGYRNQPRTYGLTASKAF